MGTDYFGYESIDLEGAPHEVEETREPIAGYAFFTYREEPNHQWIKPADRVTNVSINPELSWGEAADVLGKYRVHKNSTRKVVSMLVQMIAGERRQDSKSDREVSP